MQDCFLSLWPTIYPYSNSLKCFAKLQTKYKQIIQKLELCFASLLPSNPDNNTVI